ncbi:MAG TPA: trypsin-like peptidase domain-containing protein [Solirubrobacterales bacterium]
MGRVRNTIAIATVGSFAFAALVLPGLASAGPPAGTQKSKVFGGTPTVGALFDSATSGKHFCTASVVASPGGDVLMTAAHCVDGSAKGWSFAPGFHDGTAPYGRWTVTGAYFDPAWISEQNPTRDFAFLTVAPRKIGGARTEIQTVTGANVLATKPSDGETVTVPAYPDGQAKVPITCTANAYYEGIYPAFNCNPYIGGTSGSPWLAATSEGVKVVGLIAGLHQGGCFTYTSYSPPLGSAARATYNRAVAGVKPEVGPEAGSDGCSTGL